MPGGLPVSGDVCNGTDYGSVTATTSAVVMTAGAANVKGAWALLGVAANDISLLHVTVMSGVAARTGIVDIGVGPSGSQVVLFPNIPARTAGATQTIDFIFPCSIPAGTSIWGRLASVTAASTAHQIKVDGFGGALTHQGMSGGESIGVLTASSVSTLITTGTTANVKTGWTVLGTTTRDYGSIVVFMNQSANTWILADFSIGAAGSEIPFLNNILISNFTGAAIWLPIAIKSGQTISARAQASVVSGAVYVAIVGIFR